MSRGALQIKDPLELIRLSLDTRIYVKCRGDREINGVLHGYDKHLNMILGEAEEVHTVLEVDPETEENIYQTTKRSLDMLFLRGDSVILIAPVIRNQD